MDIREEIIQAVIEALTNRVENDVLDVVQDVLVIQLNNYEVQERCTDVAVRDNSADGLLKKFVATKRLEGIAESTLKRYADENQRLIRFLGKPLHDITTFDLRFYLSYRRENSKKKVSNRTLNGIRRCYSSFFGWLASEGLISRNPCAALKQIKFRKEVKKPYSAVELEQIRRACTNERDLALVDFLYSTGCRVSEVVRLNVSDIDFEKRRCVVIGKGDKERLVYLTEVATMNLRAYIRHRKDAGLALFTGRGTPRIQKTGIESIIRKLGRAAGVTNAHPHRFRRTLATNLLDRGMPIQDVAAILGHADLKTTQIYCYVSQVNVEASYNRYVA